MPCAACGRLCPAWEVGHRSPSTRALGKKACQQYRKVLYLPAGELSDGVTMAERTGDNNSRLVHLVIVELSIIDDRFLPWPIPPQVQQLHTLIEGQHKTA